MRRKEISKLVLKITSNIFSSLIDLILWNIFYFVEISPIGESGNITKAKILADRDLERFNFLILKRVLAQAKTRGFIKGDFTLTEEGKKRLENILPEYFGEKKWSGGWYLVIYDIPEKRKKHREILRENLKRLGFGQLQASCWISPFNFFAEVEEIIKEYNLSYHVLLAITDKLGREEAKILAERVWKLGEINNLYKDLLKKVRDKNLNKKDLYFQYLSILRKDPQLSKELLPSDWTGRELWEIFKKKEEKNRRNLLEKNL